jgi:large subunit ribosomal protein L22e
METTPKTSSKPTSNETAKIKTKTDEPKKVPIDKKPQDNLSTPTQPVAKPPKESAKRPAADSAKTSQKTKKIKSQGDTTAPTTNKNAAQTTLEKTPKAAHPKSPAKSKLIKTAIIQKKAGTKVGDKSKFGDKKRTTRKGGDKKKVGRKPAPKVKLLSKSTCKFVIDCSIPVDDGIMDAALFEKFLHDRIKVNGKAGALGDKVKLTRDKAKIHVAVKLPFSKRYLKYLSKKFLKKQQLRDWLRVIAIEALEEKSQEVDEVRVSSCQPPKPTSLGVILLRFALRISSTSLGLTKLSTENTLICSESCFSLIGLPSTGPLTFFG